MARPDAQAAASYVFSAILSYCLRGFQVPIDWGQSIYHFDAPASYSVEPLSSMAPRRRASGGVLPLFGCFILLAAVVSGSDRLGTIDLPFRRGGVLQCRAIVPNGSLTTRKRRRFTAVRLFSLTVCGGFRFRSIGDNRSTICNQRTKNR